MATNYPTQLFDVGSVASTQDMLFTLAEYVSGTITISSADNQQSIFQAIQQTLMNMVSIIDAYQIQTLMAQEYTLINRVSGILQNLSSTDQTLINNRLSSFNNLINSIYTIPISLKFDVNNLTNGIPALQDYDLLNYFLLFDFETPPSGLNITNFYSNAQTMANAWQDALTYLEAGGTQYQTTSYDSVDRMYTVSQITHDFVTNLTFANVTFDLHKQWNSLVALPSLLRDASLLYNNPSSQQSQSINVLKFVIFNLIYQTNFILSLFAANNISNVSQPNTAQLKAGESLLDFASRTTGDYSQWSTIASINNLVPPYVGTTSAVGIAVPGQQLYLPPAVVTSTPYPNYQDAFLGIDIDLGQPGTELTKWTGDFQLIRGLNNYASALYRRVLTPLGSLIYHPNYGSVLPAEVGNISTSSEATFLSSDLRAALSSDPRTQLVNSISAYPLKFGEIVLTSSVTPYGSTAPMPVNFLVRTAQSGT